MFLRKRIMKHKGRTDYFNQLWKMERVWLKYDEKTGVMTCLSCISVYGQEAREKFNVLNV